jgi:LacI family transcriptional regulator
MRLRKNEGCERREVHVRGQVVATNRYPERLVKRMKRRRRNAVTMHEVARHIGVAPMTVSRALSGDANVKPETRQRVEAAIKELGYIPNVAARNLAKAASVHIGLLYNNPSSAYMNELLVGVLEQSSHAGCQIVLEKCGSRNERSVIEKLLRDGVGGIILPPPLSDSKVALEALRAAKIPFIAVATGRPEAEGFGSSKDRLYSWRSEPNGQPSTLCGLRGGDE